MCTVSSDEIYKKAQEPQSLGVVRVMAISLYFRRREISATAPSPRIDNDAGSGTAE